MDNYKKAYKFSESCHIERPVCLYKPEVVLYNSQFRYIYNI